MVYRVRNWSAYNKALVGRYDITIWVEEDPCQAWQYAGPRQQGGQFVFSDVAIECLGTLREVYHLPLRGAEGLLRSLFRIMDVNLPVPSYSTLSRRGQSVAIHLPQKPRGALDLVVDSSGLKVCGEGEWKVRQHGASKRRTWRKIHLAIEPNSHEIQAAMMSTAGMDDGEMVAHCCDRGRTMLRAWRATARTINARSMTCWRSWPRRRRSTCRPGKTPKSGSMGIVFNPHCLATKTCGAFGKSDGSNGKKKRAIISARWRKPPYSELKRCSVTI